MIKVIIVDDHKLFRDGLKSILHDSGIIEVLADVGSANELRRILKCNTPDIVLLDISINNDSGFDLIKEVKARQERTRIIMVSMFSSEDFVMTSIRNGADGYIPKDTPQAELLNAIQQVHNGHRYFPEKIKDLLLDGIISKSKANGQPYQDPYDSLTMREKEILRMVAEGWVNQDIAKGLSISIRTVETHKFNIMQKTGSKTIVDLVKFAIRKKMIEI